MGHHNVVFPTTYGRNSGGGPSFNTEIVTTEGGQEQRFAQWEHPRRRYSINYADHKPESTQAVVEFYIAREGALNSFLFIDPGDFTSKDDGVSTPGDDVLLGTGDGSDTAFQLIKKYDDTAATKTRTIRYPKAGTVKVYLDGSETTAFTVDVTTGIVTMLAAPGSGVEVSAGFEFYVPVRFDEATDTDGVRVNVSDYRNHNIEAVDLIEVLYEDAVADDAFFGASSETTITTNVTLSKQDGLLQVFKTSTSNLKISAPDPTNLNPGGPHFVTIIANGSSAIDLHDHNDTQLVNNLSADSAVEWYVLEDNSSTKHWYVVGS